MKVMRVVEYPQGYQFSNLDANKFCVKIKKKHRNHSYKEGYVRTIRKYIRENKVIEISNQCVQIKFPHANSSPKRSRF